jgi:clan AA aspartic protease (TIGR02281 family)
MYEKGQGVAQDYAAALNWYRRAADQGYAPAKNILAVMPAPKNDVQALRKNYDVGKDYALAFLEHDNIPSALSTANRAFSNLPDGHNVFFTPGGKAGITAEVTDKVGETQRYDLSALQLQIFLKSRAAVFETLLAHGAVQAIQSIGQKQQVVRFQPTALLMVPAPRIIKPLTPEEQLRAVSVPLEHKRGIYTVRVLINNSIYLDAVVDSGAADVTIPADVVTRLVRAGTIAANDFLGAREYIIADGSTRRSETFRIRSLKVGSKMAENITGNVAPANADLLLGQSFLSRFKSFSIDNTRHVLILE